MNYDKFAEIAEQLRDRIEEMLEALDIYDYEVYPDRVSFPCPIHGGDSDEALSIFVGQKAYVLNWKCYTHHCEQEHGRGIFGFIKAVLSIKLKKPVKNGNAIYWAEQFLNYSGDHKPDEEILSKINYNKEVKTLTLERSFNKIIMTKEKIRQKSKVLPEYYLKLGYSKETLDKFDVFLCTNKGAQMHNRIVFPIFDDEYMNVIGCVGRTIYPFCSKCNLYHHANFPCPKEKWQKYKCRKWINSSDFRSDSCFFNYWNAKDTIKETGVAIIVEGQGDVLRIEDAEIHNSLGMFGDTITDRQKIILEQSGATSLIVFTDPDAAGKNALENITKDLGHIYNIYPVISDYDPGDIKSKQNMQELILPIMNKIKGIK